MSHRLAQKHTALTLAALLLLLPLAATPALAQQGGGSGLTIPITGTFTDALGGVGQFTGTFNLQRFAVVDGQIAAVGTLTGTLTDSAGTVLGSIVRTISVLLDSAATQASCEILHLELGPLDLNLLGLQVQLNRIVLDISAVPGAGNLLGNLLCAIANLLNGNAALNAIANLLNQILRAI
jgi:hypothetical protein